MRLPRGCSYLPANYHEAGINYGKVGGNDLLESSFVVHPTKGYRIEVLVNSPNRYFH